MDPQCPSCFSFQPDALLCHQCASAVETMWAAAPELIDQLQVAISKQVKLPTGGSSRRRDPGDEDDGNGTGLAHTRSPINWGAVAVRDALVVEVRLWAGDIDEVRRHPKAAEIVRDLGRAVKDAYRAIDRMQDRQYLGQCLYEEDGATCHAEVWARPGAHQVTCSQCEITHEVGERRAWLLKQAEDVLCTVKEASRYMGEVGNITVTEDRIRGYLRRGKRLAFRPGTNLIRLGDLMAVVLDDGERLSA